MVQAGLCRSEVNKRVGRVIRLFRWAVGEELIPPSIYQGLKAVLGLRKGRSPAREKPPIKPAPDSNIDAIEPYVSRQVWAMVTLQRLTGMRPGEVCQMRTEDIDRSGDVWTYTPPSHKTEHFGRERQIDLGPQAQAVLVSWLQVDRSAPLFSPADAMEEQRAERRRSRQSPMTPSQRSRKRKARPSRPPGVTYTTRSYYHAVKAGCLKAKVHRWHPNQLRHNAATRFRALFGLDTARAILGHASPAVTSVYAEADRTKAQAAMKAVG
jgi:integrase